MADDSETGLPASIEAAWGLRERTKKGPRPGLSLEQIVAAAVRIAAADGIAGVSMARVAAELGTSTMALYRYVAAKDELLALMADAVFRRPSEASDPDESWRDGLSRWAWTYHDALRRHPWVLRIPITGPPSTPNEVAWLEDGLRCLGATGLGEAEKLSVILLLSGFVRNEATLVTDIGAASAGAEIMPTWSQQLRRLTDADRFPALHAALASGVFDQDDDPDDEFVFGLERLLDGVEALVENRASKP